MWQITHISELGNARLWFSDGKDLSAKRGGRCVSSRLIIENQGFIDFTDLDLYADQTTGSTSSINLNNQTIPYSTALAQISLRFSGEGSFRFSVGTTGLVTGKLKPLPQVLAADVEYLDQKIKDNYVPYPPVSGAPGKTQDEIRALGLQFFPFSPHSFELAMAMYDWTTASFARMVILKIFEYTAMQESPLPIDQDSIAAAIFESNWPPYTPADADYMRSFLMEPAQSQQEVLTQLEAVRLQLQQFSEVENRLLNAAVAAMPRTPVFTTPLLYSGQIDMSQLSKDQFGAEFLQFPLNAGPPGTKLEIAFAQAMATFIQPGDVVTTKQVWSFSDSIDIAMHYQNGIVLVAKPPEDDSWVWEETCYITPLSNDPTKVEWVFPPGTSFRVMSAEQRNVNGKSVYVINLELQSASDSAREAQENVRAALPPELIDVPMRRVDESSFDHYRAHNTNGRRCRCVEDGHNGPLGQSNN